MKSATTSSPLSAPRGVIRTTLYDLIDAVNQTVGPENEELVVAIVSHLLNTYQGKFVRQSPPHGQWN